MTKMEVTSFVDGPILKENLGEHHLLIDFIKNLFSKSRHFDWVIAKLVANQIIPIQILEISFGKLIFTKSINRRFCPKSPSTSTPF